MLEDRFNWTVENRKEWHMHSLLKTACFECKFCCGRLPSRASCDIHQTSCRIRRWRCTESDSTGCSKTFSREQKAIDHPNEKGCPRLLGNPQRHCYICRLNFAGFAAYDDHFQSKNAVECKRLAEIFLMGLNDRSDESSNNSR